MFILHNFLTYTLSFQNIMWFAKNSLFFLFFTFILLSPSQSSVWAEKKCYIVYLGSHHHDEGVTEADFDRVTDTHHEFLQSYLGSYEKAKESMIYSYTRNINGFAAILDEKEAFDIAEHPNVVSVLLNRRRKLHTTHSWEFMSMEHNGVAPTGSILRKARYGEDTIIGNLDSGVWPEDPSFGDDGIGPIPSRWKGTCQGDNLSIGFHCNRKLIGAMYFNKGFLADAGPNAKYNKTLMNTVRDYHGHGSHTLSIAGGNFVSGANVFGFGNGTAKGGSPKARVAAYKVCWPQTIGHACYDADIVAAFDMAINDGVDVLSISIGNKDPQQYFKDGLSIAAFHAVKKGITVVCSGGNSGPNPGSVTNIAPWILTVAASTLDREFYNSVSLLDGQSFKGGSFSSTLPETKFYPLISAADAKLDQASVENASICSNGTIDPKKVRGKILVCVGGIFAGIEESLVALQAGAVGMILCNDEFGGSDIANDDVHFLPTSQITYEDGISVFSYLNSTNNPQGYIHPPITKLNKQPAPTMADFSSRGPNRITPEILKPDITAPGVDIIAAYSQGISPTPRLAFDKRRVPFITKSGTSMSCPHVAGIAGLLKTLHPDWSPSAIKSAIMTTARTRDNTARPIHDHINAKATPFSYGSGHIRPNRAMDPGLVYDLSTNDYLNFLCYLGYNQTLINKFSDTHYRCEDINIMDFNLPTITIPKLNGSVTLSRKVKNVGPAGTYTAKARATAGVSISVNPKKLEFYKIGEEKSFQLTLEVTRAGLATVFGGLTWSDGKHYVRSPIVVGGVKG
ncbi:subtilisin-like protease SBT5.4 [Vicia villosa]|uniref:subtilisin-like protease SBT5.4 n=1 Tax=Vicia villosa TaxID=3911 RepID=UPI00273CEE37|nr:subtilisin-like protease SBT5.4 [Vicia villosa]